MRVLIWEKDMPKTKKDTNEEKFQKIIDAAIIEAEAITCPFGEFVDGLSTMASTLNDRLAMAREERRSHDDD